MCQVYAGHKSMIAAAALALAAMTPSHADVFDPYTILANAYQGPLAITSAAGSGAHEIAGQVFGDRITGYYADGAREMVWIRWQGSTPIQVYVGTVNPGAGRFAGTIEGTFYAVHQLGGPTSERNAFGFRAWQSQVPGQNPPPPVTHPHFSDPEPMYPGSAWWSRALNSEGALVINLARNGDVSGWLLGDPIIGHYTHGSLAFLRMRAGTPLQFYRGSVNTVFTSPRRGLEIQGEFLALNEIAGGASAASNRFSFRAANRTGFMTLQPEASETLCLGIAGASPAEGALFGQAACASPAGANQQLALVSTFGPGYVMVVRHSGLCLETPGSSAGALVQQRRCHGGPSQQAWLPGFPNTLGTITNAPASSGPRSIGASVTFDPCLSHCGPLYLTHNTLCVSVDAVGKAVLQSCDSQHQPKWFYYPGGP